MSCGDASDQSRRFCVLTWDQVQRLDSILGETVPIHGRGNFPTLSVQPRLIVQVKQTPIIIIKKKKKNQQMNDEKNDRKDF